MQKKMCIQCKRCLILNTKNFKFSCDGYWRNTCRKCENERKRKVYRAKLRQENKPVDYLKQLREARVQRLIEKYDGVSKVLKQNKLDSKSSAMTIDIILGTISNHKIQ